MNEVRVDSEGSLRRNLNEMNKMVHMIELNSLPKTQLHPLNNQIMRSELNSAGDSFIQQNLGIASSNDITSMNSGDLKINTQIHTTVTSLPYSERPSPYPQISSP